LSVCKEETAGCQKPLVIYVDLFKKIFYMTAVIYILQWVIVIYIIHVTHICAVLLTGVLGTAGLSLDVSFWVFVCFT